MNRIIRNILILCLLSCILCLAGCRPKGILHSWELRSVLVDLHKTDALMQYKNLLGFQHEEERSIYYAQVLERHGITQAQFDSSLVWYTAHPAIFDKIYPKVMADLKAEEETYHALITKNEPTPQKPVVISLTKAQVDSIFHVTLHGLPSTWNPLVHDSEDELLPEVFIFGGGVVDSLQTGVCLP